MTTRPPLRRAGRGAGRPAFVFLFGLLGTLWMAGPVPAFGQHVRMIGEGEEWRFFRGVEEPPGSPLDWTFPAYDDAAWETGVPSLGYGNDDDVMLLADMPGAYASVYARRVFRVGPQGPGDPGELMGVSGRQGANPFDIDRLWLTVVYNHGFVAYLNGVEVARRGLGAPGTFVAHDAFAEFRQSGREVVIDLSDHLGLVRPGRNVFAIQGHNVEIASPGFTLTAALHATGPVEVVNYPYLQRPGPDRVTVAWRTAGPGVGTVLFVPVAPGEPQIARRAVEPEARTRHAVELTGLEPGTDYRYWVLGDSAPLTAGDTFRTLPPHGSERIAFLAVGDSGVNNRRGRAVRSRWIATGVPLGLRLGDLAYNNGRDEEFRDNYFGVYRDFLRQGFDMTAIGNHEARTDRAQPYLDNLVLFTDEPGGTERYYAFEAGPALFVALDTHTSSFGTGSAQRLWLERTLAASDHAWKFAFMHHGLYSCSLRHGSNGPAQQSLEPLFERYGVDVSFAGHDHGYERSLPVLDYEPGGSPVRHVVAGGGGRGLYPWSTACPWTAEAASETGFVSMSIDGPCAEMTALRPDGSVIDAEAWCKAER